VTRFIDQLYTQLRVRVNLRLAVFRQSVRLGGNSLDTTTNFIFEMNTCGYSPYVTSSLTRMGLLFTVAADPRQRSHSQVRMGLLFTVAAGPRQRSHS
jgi:hypothetical protein